MSNRAHRTFLLAAAAAMALLVPTVANAQDHASGGAAYYPGPKHAYVHNGKAVAPRNAPKAVRDLIKAANTGPRWGKPRDTSGFVARHPGGVH